MRATLLVVLIAGVVLAMAECKAVAEDPQEDLQAIPAAYDSKDAGEEISKCTMIAQLLCHAGGQMATSCLCRWPQAVNNVSYSNCWSKLSCN